MKKLILITTILFASITGTAFASNVNLTIRDEGTIIFSGSIPLQPSGTIELSGHPLNVDSVLSVLNDADISSENFSITDLQYYDSFDSFIVNCINDKCNNWQYTVNNLYPSLGMDKTILSGGENVYLYFGPHYKITLDSNSITTDDNLKVTIKNYNYENNNWIIETGVTVGIIEPDSWPTIEIKTNQVDENGETIFSSIPIGSYNVGIQPDYFPAETLTVIEAPKKHSHSSSRNTKIIIEKPIFNLKKAFDFLISQQKENGSFGENLYTDWATLALKSGNYEDQITKLIKYFEISKIENTSLTDYERHTMALMSLGLNPYNINNENYIKKITDSFDGKQFGNVNEDNDDIFALIILQNAGFIEEDKIIIDDISFILSKQKENGSWDESIDMTGAAIESLSFFNKNEQVKNALIKAKEFLIQNQKDSGGWDNASSTAWAIEGILALSEKPENWIKNNNSPIDYLGTIQDIDGGIKNPPRLGEADENLQNKIWETIYVATALSQKTWNQIMQKFDKPKEEIKTEKKIPKIITPLKKEIVKNLQKENKIKKLENLANQNTTNIINSLNTNTEKTNKSWFKNLLDKIFNIF